MTQYNRASKSDNTFGSFLTNSQNLGGFYGILTLTIIEGNFNNSSDLLSDMDPYIIVEHNNFKYRSKTLKNAGRFPEWHEGEAKFDLKISSPADVIKITAYDQDTFFDDLIGGAVITVQKILQFKYS